MDRRWYISLDALKDELGIASATTTYDAMLKRQIERASMWLERETGRMFYPVTATRAFDVPEDVPRQAIWLFDDLLAVTSITDDQGSVDSGEYFLYPANHPPYQRIELLSSSRQWVWTDSRQQAVSIAGRWGYSEQTLDTGVTLGAAVESTTATSITVSDGALIEVGWCLLIGSEQLFVSAVSDNTVTVQRGNNGTTAATHADGATILRYVPDPAAEECVILIASLAYNMRQAAGVKSQVIGDYEITYRDGMAVPDLALYIAASLKRIL